MPSTSSDGVPEIVTRPAFTVWVTPFGNPVIVTPVAPPARAYVISCIDSPSQIS